MMRPDVDRTLASLKDFQRATVEHVFRRLWIDDDQTKRFLVADEVGLGKTMVAKGVIAKTVDHLWNTDKRIDIVYICSNSQIARQNLSRLNVVGGSELKHADRLTLLPKVIHDLRGSRVNFVSFTPGTSFQVGSAGGKADERVLLYWMLTVAWGTKAMAPTRWKRFFEGGMARDNFDWHLRNFDRTVLDQELCADLGDLVDGSIASDGRPLREELEECVQAFNYLRGRPSWQLSGRRNQLIGRLRQLVARAAVTHLEPDLVILDEFQRFKDIMDADDEGAELAQAIFNHPDAKLLLLSATPYKMYTLPDEPEGDDHYRDFTRTIRFLGGDERALVVERELRVMRESILVGDDVERARQARDRVEFELRKVISRTERLSSTPDRDGMLNERPLPGVKLTAADLRSWRTFDSVARQIDTHDVFEYWRSTPYPLNFMERGTYQIRTKFQAAVERTDTSTLQCLRTASGLLNWDDVHGYRAVDPGNPKMRGLIHDVLDDGAWRLAWVPAALPYYAPAGAYADARLRSFTKRLIFSAWTVVPKAIAVLVSYEAERRATEAAGRPDRAYDDRPTTPPLQFRMDGERPAGMTAFSLLYPSPVLARVGDPLAAAQEIGAIPADREAIFAAVRGRVDRLLAGLPSGSSDGPADQRWYWVTPLLLDSAAAGDEQSSFLARLPELAGGDDEDRESRLAAHLRLAGETAQLELGPRPADLTDVLTTMAIGAPGACALRALSRVAGGNASLHDPEIRLRAFQIANGLRSLFNKPEITALLRAAENDAYWRAVLEHCVDGVLQAVLDEYAHVLVESEGLQDASSHDRARVLTEVMTEALSTRTATNLVEHVKVSDEAVTLEDHRMNSHFAARYGRAQSSDQAAMREGTVRVAYNSPFRPFVLASTSVGQEGLDFHTYGHAIVHWNLPGNPVDLEQREGRVHRYKGHAVRKNVAAEYAAAALDAAHVDPWAAIFAAARAQTPAEASEIRPFWIFTRPGGAVIERYVPAMPLSREEQQYRRLLRTLGAYRLVMGQPRQDDLIRYVGDADSDLSWLKIDLSPPPIHSDSPVERRRP